MSAVTEKLQFLITADAKSAIAAFDETGAAADKNLSKAQSGTDKLAGNMTKFGAGAVAVSGVVGVALFKTATSYEDLALSAGKMSDATGLTVEQSSRWIEVSKDMGLQGDVVQGALGKMSKALATNKDAFAANGVEIKHLKDGTEDIQGTFLGAIDKLGTMTSETDKTKLASQLFGRSWQDMSEMITAGSTSLKASLDAVSGSKVISDQNVTDAKAFRGDLDTLTDALENVGLSIGKGVMPVLGQLASGVGHAVDAFGMLNGVTDGFLGKALTIGTLALGAAGALSFLGGKAIALKESFIAVNEAGEASLTTMGGVGLGVAAAGVAFLAITSAMDSSAAQQKETAARTTEVTKSLETEVDQLTQAAIAAGKFTTESDALAATQDALADSLTGADAKGQALTLALGGLGKQKSDAVDAILAIRDAADVYSTATKNSTATTNKQAEALGAAAGRFEDSISTMLQAGGMSKDVADDLAQVAMQVYETGNNFDVANAKTQGWNQSTIDLIPSIQELAKQARTTDLDKIAAGFLQNAVASDELHEKLVKQAEAQVGVTSTTEKSLEVYNVYRGLLAKVPDDADAVTTATENTSAAYYEQRRLLDLNNSATYEASHAADYYTQKLDDQIDATNRSKQATEDETSAFLSAIDAKRALARQTTDYQGAVADLNVTIDDNNARMAKDADVIAHTKDGTAAHTKAVLDQAAALRDSSDAIDDVVSKAADMAKAQAKIQTGSEDSTASIQAQVAYLGTLQKTLAPGSALFNSIQDYINQLNAIPGVKTTTINTRYVSQGKADDDVITPKGTATGGDRSAGQLLLVGEEGPELWVPDSNGTMIPNDKLNTGSTVSAAAGGGSGGGDVHLHLDAGAISLVMNNGMGADGNRISQQATLMIIEGIMTNLRTQGVSSQLQRLLGIRAA